MWQLFFNLLILCSGTYGTKISPRLLVKRQLVPPPVCTGPYQFTLSATAASGTAVGTVSSTSSTGSPMWYTLSGTYSPYFNVNPYTGAVTTSSSFNSAAVNGLTTLILNIQSTDINGGTCTNSVTLTITGGTNNNNNNNGGGASCPYGYYSYNGFCYAQDGLFNNGNNGNYLTSSGCSNGSTVGTVSAYNALSYSVSNSNFAISSAGVITLNAATAAGTYYLLVTGYTAYGTQQTALTIYVTCGGSAAGCSAGSLYGLCFNQTTSSTPYPSLVPVYNASSYNFVTTACTAGTIVGTVGASNVTTYVINYGSNNFVITNTTGIISLSQTLTAGVYSVTAVANSNGGFSQAVPVTVTVVCPTSATSTVTSTSTSTVTSTSTTTTVAG